MFSFCVAVLDIIGVFFDPNFEIRGFSYLISFSLHRGFIWLYYWISISSSSDFSSGSWNELESWVAKTFSVLFYSSSLRSRAELVSGISDGPFDALSYSSSLLLSSYAKEFICLMSASFSKVKTFGFCLYFKSPLMVCLFFILNGNDSAAFYSGGNKD